MNALISKNSHFQIYLCVQFDRGIEIGNQWVDFCLGFFEPFETFKNPVKKLFFFCRTNESACISVSMSWLRWLLKAVTTLKQAARSYYMKVILSCCSRNVPQNSLRIRPSFFSRLFYNWGSSVVLQKSQYRSFTSFMVTDWTRY